MKESESVNFLWFVWGVNIKPFLFNKNHRKYFYIYNV